MLSLNIFILLGSVIWLIILLLPWKPWATTEFLEPSKSDESVDLSDITVLTPARDEAAVIAETAQGIRAQGESLKWILVDDQSTDGTAQIAQTHFSENLQLVRSADLADGWAGKLWALEQGRKLVTTPYILLLDADIQLAPGIVSALKTKSVNDQLDLVSLMAELRMKTFWEKLLIPSFIYFFKLLYPFALGNSRRSKIGVAAGGCVLLKTYALEQIGGFAALKHALIDDCTLAQKLKDAGFSTWIGLTRAVTSHRGYDDLAGIWNMVARSAYTQLRYSKTLLIGCTLIMGSMFLGPLTGILVAETGSWNLMISVAGVFAMIYSYRPTLRFYDRAPLWSFAMPFIGVLYLSMTWTSALRYWRGHRSRWKGRTYSKTMQKL